MNSSKARTSRPLHRVRAGKSSGILTDVRRAASRSAARSVPNHSRAERTNRHHGNSLQRQPRGARERVAELVNEKTPGFTEITGPFAMNRMNTPRGRRTQPRRHRQGPSINNLTKDRAGIELWPSTCWRIDHGRPQDARTEGTHQLLHRSTARIRVGRTRYQLRRPRNARNSRRLSHRAGQPRRFIKIIAAARHARSPGQAAGVEWTQKRLSAGGF